jgi:hypothetical protein
MFTPPSGRAFILTSFCPLPEKCAMKRLVFLIAFALSPLALHAQYWSDYLLEKGFDSRDYFLRPHRIVSVTLKNIDEGLLGILPDPLSELSFQPAGLSSISGTRLYIDLKGSAEKPKAFKHRLYPIYFYDNTLFAPPYWGRPAERKLEPLISAIYLGDIAAKYLPGFKYAVSYELIHHQGTFYEYVPFWYYGGYDAFGARTEASRNFPELEPNIKQDGLDEKTETAHLLDAYLSLKPAKFLSLGAKIGRVQTDVSGDYARLNNYNDQYNNSYRSSYLNAKSTGASIRQNELSGGVLFSLANREVGVFAGRIEGDHKQSASNQDSSFYQYGEIAQADYFGLWRYSHSSESHWRHDGETEYAGVHGNLPMQNDIAFRFRFEYQKSTVDLANGDAVLDTSYSHYRFRNYPDNVLYNYISSSRFTDGRIGEGDENITRRSGAIGLVVPMYKNSECTIGIFAESEESKTLMYEDAQVRRASHQHTETPWNPIGSQIGIEDKTLRLDKRSTTQRLALPIAMSFYLGRGFTAHVGAIKKYVKVESDEVIDIWYRTDSTVVIQPGGVTAKNPPQRIDRYISVPARRSESATNFRAGLTFQPVWRVRVDVGMGAAPAELETWQFAVLLSL